LALRRVTRLAFSPIPFGGAKENTVPHFNTILDAVGRTPLVKLNKVVPPNCATVLVKCEFMNPTGSIKDRMATHILNEAEKQGLIKPGALIVENTSGNTGQGVAMWAAVRGYRCVFTMPDKMSLEKVNMLKAFGAEVVITPTDVPGDSPQHYVQTAKRIARETPGAFYVNQYHNPLNIDAHTLSTGPEIWKDTEGTVDAIVAGAGTGGTVSGIGRYFKKNHPHVRIVGVDPIGSVHYHYFYTKTMPTPHVYKVEGIGEDILCDAMDYSVVDEFHQTNDKEAFTMARRLVREEGFFCGGSSGCNVHIAIKIAKQLGPGKTVVTFLCDSATRYTTKFLNDQWMKDYGFLGTDYDMGLVEDILASRPAGAGTNGAVITARESDSIAHVIELFKKHGVSQVPVVDDKGHPRRMVAEVDVLRGLQQNHVTPAAPVTTIAQPLGGMIYPKARIEELFRIFETDQVAVVVDGDRIVGIVSKVDVLEFMAKRK
jgi:cystathionine beta-synthase